MTDRELLEKAAKAAGLDVRLFTNGLLCFWLHHGPQDAVTWNPLTDDGDALRLAVKLNLFFKPEFAHFLSLERFADQDFDDSHAHRRAIVRAAAVIWDATGGKQ
jgi:hypothetical protein